MQQKIIISIQNFHPIMLIYYNFLPSKNCSNSLLWSKENTKSLYMSLQSKHQLFFVRKHAQLSVTSPSYLAQCTAFGPPLLFIHLAWSYVTGSQIYVCGQFQLLWLRLSKQKNSFNSKKCIFSVFIQCFLPSCRAFCLKF
jgi:hypothetical protein